MNNNRLAKKYFLKKCFDEYCSGLFSDELDKLNLKHQVSVKWRQNNSKLRLFGIVRTLVIEEIDTNDERIEVGLGFLSRLSNEEVIVVKGSKKFAYFGELMTRLSIEIGVKGAIIDGLTRDTFYTQSTKFPIFARGYSPVDIKGRGRVKKTDKLTLIDGISVSPGDYVFADSDAVVFIPKEVFSILLPKLNNAALNEYKIKQKIKAGASIKEILIDHREF